jgi:hypothetical protein
VHIRINVTVPVSGPSGQAEEEDLPPAVAAALVRLERTGGPHVREVADGLVAMGYVLAPSVPRDESAAPQNYARVIDPASPSHGVGYLTPQNLSFSRMSDRSKLKDLPGARVLATEVAFTHLEGAARPLEVAKMLKG